PGMRVGVNLTSIGVSADWWLASARRLDEAGFDAVWCWDHFLSRGDPTDPVLECWTMLSAAAAVTERIHVGSLVTNVMNRHPSVLARMAAAVQQVADGRLEVGIGIGGFPREHDHLGIPFPPAAERVEHLEEAVQVLRALWGGGPVSFEGRHYRLDRAHAFPVPVPPPRLIIGGETRAGARLAARLGDAWTTDGAGLIRDRASYLQALAAAARRREDVSVLVLVDLDRHQPVAGQALVADLPGEMQRWAAEGADELIIGYVRPDQLDAVVAAGRQRSPGDRGTLAAP
ncbi:MAG: LLM class flavin-dependent oxidoreductase, partial [Candidatus Limnocylindrales bacterium]